MSLLTKAALLLAASASFTSVFAAPTIGTNPGGFKTHQVSATSAGTSNHNHIPGHGTHFELPEHHNLKQRNSNSVRSIPGGGEIQNTETPQSQSQSQSQTMYTNHTYVPVEAYNKNKTSTSTVNTKRDGQALSGANGEGVKKHIPMPHKSSLPFIDQTTGISFQRFYDETTQFGFALALSSLPSSEEAQNDATDFIAQLSFPLNSTTGLGKGAGWGGISISSKLTASHLPLFLGIQTDGFGNLAFSSFTETVKSAASDAASSAGDAADAATTGDAVTTAGQQAASTGQDLAFKIRTIESGTSINSTLLTYTFLCEGCLSISKCAANLDSWKAQGKTKVLRLGWATGDTVASGAADSTSTSTQEGEAEQEKEAENSKKYAYHRLGFGHLKIDLEGALQQHTAEQFNSWKALAMAEEVRGFEGVAPPFAMDLVKGVSNSEGGASSSNLEKSKGGEAEKKEEEEGEKGVESESDSESDSDSDSDCGCESDSDSDEEE